MRRKTEIEAIEPSTPPGIIVALDTTPIYGTDSIISVIEALVHRETGQVPFLDNIPNRTIKPVLEPKYDIYKNLADWIDQFYRLRYESHHSQVRLLLGGALTELAWISFWQASGVLDKKLGEINSQMIEGILTSTQVGNRQKLSSSFDITCVLILPPKDALATWPGRKPPSEHPGWAMGTKLIGHFNDFLREAVEKYRIFLPNLLVRDLERGPELSGTFSEPGPDLYREASILGRHICLNLPHG